MRDYQQDTPPSSISGDDINAMDEENLIYMGDVGEDDIDFDEEDAEDNDSENEAVEEHASMIFNKHVGSVFCCDIHPTGNLAITGGEDDKAYVWSVSTGEVVSECVGHKDSVIFVGFSFDGAFVASADMSGLIKVWKCNLHNDQPWPVVYEYEANDLTWGLWHFGTRILIFGTVTGDIYVCKIPTGETKILQGHTSKVECGKLFPDGLRLAAGYEDGSVKVWDIKEQKVLHQIPPGTHSIRVTAIDTHPDNNLMASISTDGKVVLATSSNGKIVGELETESDLEVVSFEPDAEYGYLALGTLNGSVTIWDAARQMIRNHCSESDNIAAGVTKVMWVKHHLVTACLDGALKVYDGRSGEQVSKYTGHRSEVLDLCYNAEQNLILTTSDDGTARIFLI